MEGHLSNLELEHESEDESETGKRLEDVDDQPYYETDLENITSQAGLPVKIEVHNIITF